MPSDVRVAAVDVPEDDLRVGGLSEQNEDEMTPTGPAEVEMKPSVEMCKEVANMSRM